MTERNSGGVEEAPPAPGGRPVDAVHDAAQHPVAPQDPLDRLVWVLEQIVEDHSITASGRTLARQALSDAQGLRGVVDAQIAAFGREVRTALCLTPLGEVLGRNVMGEEVPILRDLLTDSWPPPR